MIDYLEKNKSFAIIFFTSMALEIFIVSSIPGKNLSIKGIDPSLFYHLIVFFLFNFFLVLLITGNKKIKIKYLAFSIFFSILYAILDEIHQFFVPFRVPSITDAIVDTMGIFLSTITYINYKKNKIKITY